MNITPDVRHPRLRVLLDNADLIGCVRANVTQNAFYQADRFTAEFSLSIEGGKTLQWWSDQSEALLDIQVGFQDRGSVPWVSLIVGAIDQVSVHPVTGNVEVEGRDLTARLIEAKTQETFQNQTSSQVVTTLAGRHGLTPDVTPTTTPVSRYYQIDHTHQTMGEFSRTTTEWDLLTYLAQKEGFDVYVTGRTLHFHPTAPDTSDPYVVARNNVIGLQLSRSLTLAKDIEVVVQSWHSKQGRAFKKTARAIGAKAASAGATKGAVQRYVLNRPNLTEDAAQKLANAELARLSAHERKISFTLPGETDLSPRKPLRVDGTSSSWDQGYQIDTIEREISFDAGFTSRVTAKNHSPQSEAARP